MNSYFKNLDAKQQMERWYQNKLDELRISYEFQNIETSFGNTNVILTGSDDKPPMVLLHGSNGCAPMAIEKMLGLLDGHKLYAIDVVGQPNMSTGIRPSKLDNSYGQWMYEILSRLSIRNAVLVGISFGGFISWKTLLLDERRIIKAFLIAPVGIVPFNPWKIFWKIGLPMKLYQWRKQPKYIHKILNEKFSEVDEPSIEFYSKVLQNFDRDITSTPLIKKNEAQKIKTPIHIIAADQDVLYTGYKLLKRAKEVFPSLGEVLLLKNSKHVPGIAGYEIITHFIKNNSK